MPYIFLCKAYRDVAKTFCMGYWVKFTGVSLNTMGAGEQTWVSKTCSVLDTLLYSVFTIFDCPWLGCVQFEIKAFRWLENAILELAFANIV